MFKKLKGLYWAVASKIGGKFTNQHYVFQLDKPNFPQPDANYIIRGYANFSELPATLIPAKLMDAEIIQQKFSDQEHFYVLTTRDGTVGSFFWVKTGRQLKDWFIRLKDEDRIAYSGYTAREMRGKKLIAHVWRVAVESEKVSADHWYADCHIYNKPAYTYLIRSGFKMIGKIRGRLKAEVI